MKKLFGIDGWLELESIVVRAALDFLRDVIPAKAGIQVSVLQEIVEMIGKSIPTQLFLHFDLDSRLRGNDVSQEVTETAQNDQYAPCKPFAMNALLSGNWKVRNFSYLL